MSEPGPGSPGAGGPESAARVPPRVWLALSFGLVAFGSSAILVRLAAPAPGLALAAWRTLLSAALLAPFALPRIRPEWRALPASDRRLIAVAGAVLALHFITWIESLYHTSVASASVLVTTSPLFIAALAFVVLKERPRRRTVFSIVAAVAGAALIGWGDAGGAAFPRAALGNGLALLASLLVAVYLLIGRAVRQRVSFLAFLFPLYAVVAAVTWALALARGVDLGQPPRVLAVCALMALGPGLIGHGSINYALRYVPAALLGLLTLAEPVLATLGALVLFGETPSALAFAGMAVVLGAIAAVFAGGKAPPPPQPP